MWLQRVFLRLSIRNRKPRFQEIKWTDDGEFRPVTRGKAKQFGYVEDIPPEGIFRGSALSKMESSLSCFITGAVDC